MTDTTIETLEKALNELYNQIDAKNQEHKQILTDNIHILLDPINDLFKEFNIGVSSNTISFKHNEGWYNFDIYRSVSYRTDGESYGKPTLRYSSYSELDEIGMKMTICLGILAQHCLTESPLWIDLMNNMNYCNYLYKTEVKELSSQAYKLSNDISKLKEESMNQKFQIVFNKGTFKLNKEIYFHYGISRWDKVYSDEFFWEENKGGKTYNISYINMDGIKCYIQKRIKKIDIESFIKHNHNKIIS